jgi:cell wall-associated NlpC family hydrolase
MTGDPSTSFYALGPEFEWLASAWDGFARDLAETGGTLRHITEATAADPAVAAESSGLAALESATDRLVRELVDDAARIRRTLATYEHADATVHASVPSMPGMQLPTAPRVPASSPTSGSGAPSAVPHQPAGPASGLWHPEPDAESEFVGGADSPAGTGSTAGTDSAEIAPDASAAALGTLSQFRRDILARADRWVGEQVPYSQGVWHEGYRTDCSGFVSMCWGLRDSMVTSTFPQISHRIAKEDLRAGDILNNTDVATGHVVLFDRWADYAHSTYVGYELCPGGTLHHVVPYPYYPGFGDFEPYRYDQAGAV